MHWNNVKAFVTRNRAKVAMTTSLACMSLAAMAQTAGGSGPDYGASIDQVKTDVTSFFTTNGPKLLGVLLVMLTFGLVWKLIKRSVKS